IPSSPQYLWPTSTVLRNSAPDTCTKSMPTFSPSMTTLITERIPKDSCCTRLLTAIWTKKPLSKDIGSDSQQWIYEEPTRRSSKIFWKRLLQQNAMVNHTRRHDQPDPGAGYIPHDNDMSKET